VPTLYGASGGVEPAPEARARVLEGAGPARR